ncbi:MAG: endonuclease III [Chloroflexi bacterium]|nr:MAG: endonuclease III [Chloroflexota bacterium]
MPSDDLIPNQINLVLHRLEKVYGFPTWRDPLPPIDELISTILSQNTNDHNRDQAFYKLKSRFNTWEQARDAPETEIIEAIRIAGLANLKGPRIKAVLNEIYQERGNFDLSFLADLPLEEARKWLLKFKGVGRKTAAIVLQFSLNRPAFPVDTHIYRVTGRLGVRPEKMSVEQTHFLMEIMVEPKDYYAGHLNLIRLGRESCHPRNPDCANCPINQLCNFNRIKSN